MTLGWNKRNGETASALQQFDEERKESKLCNDLTNKRNEGLQLFCPWRFFTSSPRHSISQQPAQKDLQEVVWLQKLHFQL